MLLLEMQLLSADGLPSDTVPVFAATVSTTPSVSRKRGARPACLCAQPKRAACRRAPALAVDRERFPADDHGLARRPPADQHRPRRAPPFLNRASATPADPRLPSFTSEACLVDPCVLLMTHLHFTTRYPARSCRVYRLIEAKVFGSHAGSIQGLKVAPSERGRRVSAGLRVGPARGVDDFVKGLLDDYRGMARFYDADSTPSRPRSRLFDTAIFRGRRLPVEDGLSRGEDTPRFGPMKPVGS